MYTAVYELHLTHLIHNSYTKQRMNKNQNYKRITSKNVNTFKSNHRKLNI